MRNIILSVVALLSMSMTAIAQEENTSAKERPQKMDRTEMIKKHTERMVEKYGLNAEQAAALQALNEKSMPKMRGPRPGGPRPEGADSLKARPGKGEKPEMENGERPEKPAEGQTADKKERKGGHRGGPDMEAYNAELQKIMTADQYKAYTEDMEKMRQRGPRGGQRGPRPEKSEKSESSDK